MYTILIADDELITLEMLKDFIQWGKLGINKIYTAEDGLEALEKSIKYQPDIIISDIKMPGLNGIDFISKITKKLPNTKFIFLSGYTDKEYLMSAIKLRAINYIEKPINLREISISVKNAVEECNKIATNNIKRISYIKRELCDKMIHSKIDYNSIKKILSTININISVNNKVSCIFIRLDKGSNLTALIEDLELNNTINFILEEKTFVFFHFSSSDNSPDIKGLLNKKLLNNINYLASIGDNVPIHDYQITYLQAKELNNLCFFKGFNSIVYSFDNVENTASFSFPNITNSLIQYILDNEIQTARTTLKEIFNRCKNAKSSDIYELKKYFIDMTIVLKHLANERNYTNIHDNCNTAIQNITNALTLNNIYTILMKLIEELTQKIHQFTNTEYIVNKIIHIIDSDYSNEDLSINSISELLGLTPAYICRIFKKNIGKTINNYITDKRINKSKELLSQTTHKIYSIANEVGYKDGKYFSKVFEKHIGIKPRKYREINAYEK